MASIINASTSGAGGVITTADASGVLQLQTGGTAAVTVDASQNVGIGTSSPSDLLELRSSDPRIRLTDSDTSGYAQIRTGGTDASLILEADAGNTLADSDMIFRVDAAERMRITANGGLAFAGASNYGTSGQVLQSNGDAAPTWVAAPSPTTANVLAATAGAAAGDIGTYAFLGQTSLTTTTYTVGSNYSGLGFGAARSTTLANGALVNQSTLSAASGTWKCMGNDGNVGSATRLTVFLRIA